MSDETLRRLERRAASGDTDAEHAARAERCRRGLCCAGHLPEVDPDLETDPSPLRDALWSLMHNLSEECWCAGWLIDLEQVLPRAAVEAATTGKPVRLGIGRVDPGYARAMIALSEALGGWVDMDKRVLREDGVREVPS